MIKNPPPAPNLLRSFAENPIKAGEIAELQRFLYLLWESLGGGGDSVGDLEFQVQDVGRLSHDLQGVKDGLASLIIGLDSTTKEVRAKEVSEDSKLDARLKRLEQRVKDLEIQ